MNSIRCLISTLVGWFASKRLPRWILYPLLKSFVKYYRVNLAESDADLRSFSSFQAFFTRTLSPDLRPISSQAICVSPADGRVQSCGHVQSGELIQAKGLFYSLEEFLAVPEYNLFLNSQYVTIYLSPRDCHRVFSPVDGDVVKTVHVPGQVMPVKSSYVSKVPQLYIINERVVMIMKTSFGWVAVVMVAALNVGNIGLDYQSDFRTMINRNDTTVINHEHPFSMTKGKPLATFYLGSTVVLLAAGLKRPFSADVMIKENLVKYGSLIC